MLFNHKITLHVFSEDLLHVLTCAMSSKTNQLSQINHTKEITQNKAIKHTVLIFDNQNACLNI